MKLINYYILIITLVIILQNTTARNNAYKRLFGHKKQLKHTRRLNEIKLKNDQSNTLDSLLTDQEKIKLLKHQKRNLKENILSDSSVRSNNLRIDIQQHRIDDDLEEEEKELNLKVQNKIKNPNMKYLHENILSDDDERSNNIFPFIEQKEILKKGDNEQILQVQNKIKNQNRRRFHKYLIGDRSDHLRNPALDYIEDKIREVLEEEEEEHIFQIQYKRHLHETILSDDSGQSNNQIYDLIKQKIREILKEEKKEQILKVQSEIKNENRRHLHENILSDDSGRPHNPFYDFIAQKVEEVLKEDEKEQILQVQNEIKNANRRHLDENILSDDSERSHSPFYDFIAQKVEAILKEEEEEEILQVQNEIKNANRRHLPKNILSDDSRRSDNPLFDRIQQKLREDPIYEHYEQILQVANKINNYLETISGGDLHKSDDSGRPNNRLYDFIAQKVEEILKKEKHEALLDAMKKVIKNIAHVFAYYKTFRRDNQALKFPKRRFISDLLNIFQYLKLQTKNNNNLKTQVDNETIDAEQLEYPGSNNIEDTTNNLDLEVNLNTLEPASNKTEDIKLQTGVSKNFSKKEHFKTSKPVQKEVEDLKTKPMQRSDSKNNETSPLSNSDIEEKLKELQLTEEAKKMKIPQHLQPDAPINIGDLLNIEDIEDNFEESRSAGKDNLEITKILPNPDSSGVIEDTLLSLEEQLEEWEPNKTADTDLKLNLLEKINMLKSEELLSGVTEGKIQEHPGKSLEEENIPKSKDASEEMPYGNISHIHIPLRQPYARNQKRPHIIFILADDLGFNDVSFNGMTHIPTPNIDALAFSGIALNRYYTTPICTPSRSALLTGMHPIHTGMQHNVILGCEPWGLPLEYKLMPEYLKDLGYRTRMIGKWHLGYWKKKYTPTFRGFESHYGFWSGHHDYYDHTAVEGPYNKWWGLDMRRNMEVDRSSHGKYSTTLFTEESIKVIKDHSKNSPNQPLFLYLAHVAVHSANGYNLIPGPDESVENFPQIHNYYRKKFAVMLTKLDESVGHIVKALRTNGMLKNSVIVFSTDNGGAPIGGNKNAASNYPLRGVKNTLWEGGVRGAGFVWSPLIAKPQRVSHQLMHIQDWLPTLYYLGGGNPDDLENIDGVNMWPALSKNHESPRKELLHNIDKKSHVSALTDGKWKIVKGTTYKGLRDSWYGPSGRNIQYNYLHVSNSMAGKIMQHLNMAANVSVMKDIRRETHVHCKMTWPEVIKQCEPLKADCLFNILDDPCEQNNVAEQYPDILRKLRRKLVDYESTAREPLNKNAVEEGNPKYYDYVWTNFDLPYALFPSQRLQQLCVKPQ